MYNNPFVLSSLTYILLIIIIISNLLTNWTNWQQENIPYTAMLRQLLPLQPVRT